jgi:hypothetical protein
VDGKLSKADRRALRRQHRARGYVLILVQQQCPFRTAIWRKDMEDGQRKLADDGNVIEGQEEKRDRMTKSTQQVPIRQASSICAPYRTAPEPIPYQYTGRCHHRQHQYRSDERYVKQVQRDYLKGGSHPEEEFSTLNQKADHLSYA